MLIVVVAAQICFTRRRTYWKDVGWTSWAGARDVQRRSWVKAKEARPVIDPADEPVIVAVPGAAQRSGFGTPAGLHP